MRLSFERTGLNIHLWVLIFPYDGFYFLNAYHLTIAKIFNTQDCNI